MNETEFLDKFWEAILSEDPDRIQRAWSTLSRSDQQAVLAHLEAMSDQEGWQPAQLQAARAALHLLQSGPPG